MNGTPGLSLFQGVESLQVNTSEAQRIEEEEAQADHKRREEELNNDLQNAFDDLMDDDDETFESNSLVGQSKVIDPDNIVNTNNYYAYQQHNQNDNEIESLRSELNRTKLMLESKANEVNRFVLDRKKCDEQINELKKRLALSEAEKERSHMTRQQTHDLLVESKAKISEQDDQILKLKVKIKTVGDTNADLHSQLEHSKTILSDLQHKYQMVERNVQNDRQTDAILKQTNERHTAQMEMMQQQINGLSSQLADREQELKSLDARYKELQRCREALLVEKSETINQLTKNIEESQLHCQKLLYKSENAQETFQLKATIGALTKQTEDMQRTINNLTHRLESSNIDFDQQADSMFNDGSTQLHRFKRNLVVGSTPIVDDQLASIKRDLVRYISTEKENRKEIKKLEDQLTAKNDEIKKLKDDENDALKQMMNYKEESERLSNKLKKLQNEFASEFDNRKRNSLNLSNRTSDQNAKHLRELEQQNDQIASELTSLKQDYENLQANYYSLRDERDQIDAENENLRKQASLSNDQTIESLRIDLEKSKFLLNDAQKECDRLKNLYIDLSGTKDQLSRELHELKTNDLHKELYVQKEKVVSLERANQLFDMKCTELKKMLEKEKFDHEKDLVELHDKCEKEKLDCLKDIKNVSNTCSKCIDQMSAIAKYEIENLQLQNKCKQYEKELRDLHASVRQSKDQIKDLREKNIMKLEHDKMLAELKEKAQQFEEYIRNQSSTSKTTSSSVSPKSSVERRDQSVSTSPDFDKLNERTQRDTEQRMAKILSAKIKAIEDSFGEQFEKYKQNMEQLSANLEETEYHLKIRAKEVELLKQAILSEREKIGEVLQRKDAEAQEKFQKQNEMLRQCRDELEATQKQMHLLSGELEERRLQFDGERHSMSLLMKQWNEEKLLLEAKESNFKKIIRNFEAEKEKIVQQMNGKYQSAKKTAANYKRYAEDKDKHIAQENERIKIAYDSAIKKIQENMEKVIRNNEKQADERIAKIENEYKQKLLSVTPKHTTKHSQIRLFDNNEE